MKTIDLIHDDPRRLFGKYLVPSISATLVTSIYVLADTIMIGKGVGATALATLNLILPLFTLLFGTGLLLGVGGAILMSVAQGSQNQKLAQGYFTTAVVAAGVISIIYMVGGNLFLEQIGRVLGCSDHNMALFKSYSVYLMRFAPVFIFSSLLQAFVRNDRAPKTAMIAVIAGGVMNIVLDYLFIYKFGMGMEGGAIATVMGSSATCAILLTHFLSKGNTLRLDREGVRLVYVGKILHSGFPSFLVEMANGVITLLFNLQTLKYIGELGVTVYSVIANVAIVAMSLFNGVSQGAQPIMAANLGANQPERVRSVRKLGAKVAFLIGIALFGVGTFYPEFLVNIFVDSTPEMMVQATPAIRIYFIAFLMMSFNLFYSTYFQSILQPGYAMLIGLLRGVILSSLLVYLLPMAFGIQGIWMVMPLAEAITLGVTVGLVRKQDRKEMVTSYSV